MHRDIYSVFGILDANKDNVLDKAEGEKLFSYSDSLDENIEILKFKKEDDYFLFSNQDKLNVATQDAREFIKDTDSKHIDPFERDDFKGIIIDDNVPKGASKV
ncbi:MAG: hypothetical protein MZU97_02035 [Bacillus subtilis]|nr:hypothetical protein [Bacillus subtilis]